MGARTATGATTAALQDGRVARAAAGETRLSRVCVRYGRAPAALAEINLAFAPGEQVAVIGPSGAGKTTLLHTLACALRPAAGEVTVLGTNPWALPGGALHALRRRLFLAPQVPPLPPRQRVVHAVLAGRLPQWGTLKALKSLVYPTDAEIARQALARFHLEDKLFLRCDRLSGGERQRVALARSLVSAAELLLLDEPVSSLDPALGDAALETLQAEAARRGATLVVSLHAVDLALARFPRLLGVKAGRVAFDLPRPALGERLLADLYGAEPGATRRETAGAEADTPAEKRAVRPD
jgi:phosphonate transport system ATP-binding protein